MSALLEDMKDQIGINYHGENLSMWSLRVSINLMAPYQPKMRLECYLQFPFLLLKFWGENGPKNVSDRVRMLESEEANFGIMKNSNKANYIIVK